MSDTRLPPGSWDTHCHIFPVGFQTEAGRPSAPDDATPEDYRRVMNKLGIDRTIIVQPNAYGTDNSALIATLKRMGSTAIGIAAVAPGTQQNELDFLHQSGVRGARVMDLGGGAVPLSQLEAVVAMVKPLSWVPVIQFDGTNLAHYLNRLSAIDVPWILDHYGKFLSGITPSDIDAVKSLMDGHCRVKFSAHCEASQSGAPDYQDIANFSRILLEHRPDRVLWGSNWPHLLNARTDRPDDQILLRDVLSWIPVKHRLAVFVQNPANLFEGLSVPAAVRSNP